MVWFLNFFADRWRAQACFQTVFWRDLVILGTLINVSFSIVGLMFVAQGYSGLFALTLYFLIFPYNVFLLLSIWRWPGVKSIFKAASGGWFLLVSLA
jgi:hypothetical protein